MLGVAVMSELKPRFAIAAILIGFFAIFHGEAEGWKSARIFRIISSNLRLA